MEMGRMGQRVCRGVFPSATGNTMVLDAPAARLYETNKYFFVETPQTSIFCRDAAAGASHAWKRARVRGG